MIHHLLSRDIILFYIFNCIKNFVHFNILSINTLIKLFALQSSHKENFTPFPSNKNLSHRANISPIENLLEFLIRQ